MSWRAQNRSKDAKTPSVGLAMLIKPELDCCPVQPYVTPVDLHSVHWSLRSKISRSAAISLTEQLKSQLTQAQQLVTRRLVPYIVRDGQWQCGIAPTSPSMTHPARRVMPARPVHVTMCELAPAAYEPPAPPPTCA
jgi:hypothetical protein